jgi:hypothetical protein
MTAGSPAGAGDIPSAALLQAAASGDVKLVDSALAAGASLDARDGQQRTALLIAIDKGHAAVARRLVAAGAGINAQAANMDTPWLLAGARGQHELLAAMLPKGPDYTVRNRFGGNALIPACERAHVETVRFLLAHSKIPVDHVNNLGWTCLLEIVILGDGGPRHIEVARLVLDAGADPNLADRDGVTPLQHARRRAQREVAALIAAKGGR